MLEKPAESSVPLNSLIASRWSPVHFSSQPIPADILTSLFEAARWAPSSYNEQPWSFMLASSDQPGEFQKMLGCLLEGNQTWARNAGALVLSVAHKLYARNSKPNQHAWHDVGLATENLILQATSQRLVCHVMGGFNPMQARLLHKIPDDCEPVAVIAIGYPGEGVSTEPGLADRDRAPRSRKSLSSLLYQGEWGTPAQVTE